MKELSPAEKFFKEANKKYEDGDGIDDMELAALIDHYTKGIRFLEQLGPEFGLALKECRRRLLNFEDFRRARRSH